MTQAVRAFFRLGDTSNVRLAVVGRASFQVVTGVAYIQRNILARVGEQFSVQGPGCVDEARAYR